MHVPLSYWIGETARPLIYGTSAAIGATAVWSIRDATRAWRVLGLTFVCLTPTMHPWYLLWALVPSLASGRRDLAAASVCVPISYLVLGTWDAATGTWDAGPWLWWITWTPAVAAFLITRWRQDPCT